MNETVYSAFGEIYDRVMRDVDYDSWAKHVIQLARQFDLEVHNILELACGTGNHALRFARMGYSVVGVDRSETMLQIAEEKQKNAKVEVVWRRADMDDFSHLGLPPDFDLVTCLYDSLNYILEKESVLRCFQQVHAHLRQGGGFIFDVTTEYNLLQNFAGYTFAENFENASYIWENEYDIVKKICSSKVTVFTNKDGIYTKRIEVHKQRVYSTSLLTKMLESVGFEVCGTFHDMTDKPVQQKCERIHFVCKKKVL